MLDFQPPTSKGEEGEEEKEEIPSPHHTGSSSSSFMEILIFRHDSMI